MHPKNVSPGEVARILAIIGDPPNPRKLRQPGDLEGDFDEWFDGGAIRHHTGHTYYTLGDGTLAVVGVFPWLDVSIRLPDDTQVHVTQGQARPFPGPLPPAPSPSPVPPYWEKLPECRHTGADFRFCTHCGARSDHPVEGPEPQAFVCSRCQGRTVPPEPFDTQQDCRECGCPMHPGLCYCPWCGGSTMWGEE